MATRKVIKTAIVKSPNAPDTRRATIINDDVNEDPEVAAVAGELRSPTESGDTVTVLIPRNFNLTLDDGIQVHYGAGVDEMPIEHASHWYSKAMGVEVYTKG